MLRDSRSQVNVTRLSLPKSFGLRVANLMAELSIDPTLVYVFRLPRVGYWQFPVISLCPAMDGKKDFMPALSHARGPQPYCDDCLVPLTVRHLLVECPSLIKLRHHYLYRCRGRDSGVYYISKVLGPECLAQISASATADLHVLLTSDLSAALDNDKATAVVALDIEGILTTNLVLQA
ncbi:hypothetical protein E2C01_055629 [Portunus trituberculatus]|uniref:Uncharacterized protein n=1 Tax=Portunus trituberculatus TaxID=210409 RepID=A0A5B7GVB2_PORTR|nr:hypothetical protein [Portunus trituberculatus]